MEAGAIRASGAGVPTPTSGVGPWVAAGGMAQLTLAVQEAALVDAHIGLAVPLVRDTFYFLPSTDVYKTPAVVGSAGLGTRVLFR
jgi:hypothetical protein